MKSPSEDQVVNNLKKSIDINQTEKIGILGLSPFSRASL